MRPLLRDHFKLFLSILLFLCVSTETLKAQSTPPATPVVTQKLIDDVVEAISAAVVEKLKKDGSIAAKPSPDPAPVASEPAQDLAADRVTAFVGRAEVVLGSYPELWRNLSPYPRHPRQERERRARPRRLLPHAFCHGRGCTWIRSLAASGPGWRATTAGGLLN